jgi:hypothetical protein
MSEAERQLALNLEAQAQEAEEKEAQAQEAEEKEEKKPTFRDTFKGSVNIPATDITKHIRHNIRRLLPQVDWHAPNDYEVALLCGGPSLEWAEIPSEYKIATVNGTYQWALDNGYKPSIYAQHDAREFNSRFVSAPVDSCRYLLCSQVHPSVFDRLTGYDVRIWHAVSEQDQKVLDRYYMKRWRKIPGGSTIGTRMIYLLYMLGVRTIRVYGMDCSLADKGEHHAYKQKENDRDRVGELHVESGTDHFKAFRVSSWMVAQLDELLQLAPNMPDDLNIAFEGDGLWQHVISETYRLGRPPSLTMGVKA